jgi:hypothetical protein
VDAILAPDVFVNASVALGSPPDKVVTRVLGHHKGESASTEWILGRIEAMLNRIESFKHDAIQQQLGLIRQLVRVVADGETHAPDDWEKALVAAAKAGGAKRVITDHPDLLAKEETDGVEFISSEAWLVEQQMPPPPPPTTPPKP